MIRLEIVLKDKWGSPLSSNAIERRLKAELAEAVLERAKLDDLEVARIQFLGPKAGGRRP